MASLKRLGLMEFSDRELLNVVLDYEDEQGWVKTEQIAEVVGIQGDKPHAMRCVGIRFAWMKRYGVMEKGKRHEWRLTTAGRKIALGALTEVERSIIQNLASDQVMEATRALTARYGRVGQTASTMMRRAWQSGTAKR